MFVTEVGGTFAGSRIGLKAGHYTSYFKTKDDVKKRFMTRENFEGLNIIISSKSLKKLFDKCVYIYIYNSNGGIIISVQLASSHFMV